MLAHCQLLWPDLNIIDDHSMEDGTPLYGHRTAKSLSYIRKDGIRYGCSTNKKSQVDSFAFISTAGSRVPIQIHYLFLIEFAGKSPQVSALVRRMVSDANIPVFPWDL